MSQNNVTLRERIKGSPNITLKIQLTHLINWHHFDDWCQTVYNYVFPSQCGDVTARTTAETEVMRGTVSPAAVPGGR